LRLSPGGAMLEIMRPDRPNLPIGHLYLSAVKPHEAEGLFAHVQRSLMGRSTTRTAIYDGHFQFGAKSGRPEARKAERKY
jgi:hypothetical protein